MNSGASPLVRDEISAILYRSLFDLLLFISIPLSRVAFRAEIRQFVLYAIGLQPDMLALVADADRS